MEREELRQESAIITDQEAEKLLHEWNRTKIDYPRDKCVHHLFEEQVMRSPDSIAVVYEHEHATYAELNAKANRLAHYLVKKGVKEESIVAVFLERGIDMLVGLLAISKVGATYLPLDPIYPKVRIEMVLNDARPVLCLTQRSLIDHLPQSEAKLVLIDDKEKYAGESTDNLPYGKPLTPLYIIFTSGSTGKPKGVPVTQRSTVNLINCFTRLLQVTTKDIILMVTTITFDIAESDIYLALLNGGKLVIATRETSMNMELLKEKLETSKATIFEATPITHKMLIQAGWKGKKDLKLVSGGDEMSRELGAELVKRVKEVFNVYGPTETTIYNTYKRVVPEDAEGEGCVPLGRPVDNNQLYILDTELKLVPVGIPGELYIGGDGLSPGYLNNPEMTASRFVKNPFSEKPDDLIFKSGDLVKYLPDSTIVFLARIDTQVKIRGFRIELGEIESTICSYPGIKEAIVVAPENPSGEKVLVAYYTLESSEDIDLENLRSLLKSKLPDYLVPSFFSKLDKIPLTLTNKVDRRTLTATGLPTVVDDSNFVAPSTDNEILLAKIWEDILKVDRIGIHSGFFELGGHSLLATQLITRIKNEFNVEIPFGKIFEHLTIAGLLSYFDEQSTTVQKKEKPPIPRQSSGRDEFPLSSSQRRIWFMEKFNPGIKAYNNPLDYHITGDIDIKAFQRTIEYLIQRHESFRTIFPEINGEPIQKVLPSCPADLSIIHLEEEVKEKIPELIRRYSLENANYQFDLARGPLFRFQILRTGAEESVLLINFHHIITDAVSLEITMDEFKQVYEALVNSKSVNLPLIPIRYSDFSLFENQWQDGDECSNQLEFWKKELHGVPDALILPIDYHRPKKTTYNGSEFHFSIDAELKEKLTITRKRTGAGMPLLSAFAILLHRYSLQDDFVLGFPVANRTYKELEHLTGVFINTLPIRFTFPDEITISEVIQNTKRKFLAAFENQEIPINRLVDGLKLKRTMNINPLFQALFNYICCLPYDVELGGATLKLVNGERVSAQFDLTLTINDNQQDIDCAFEYNTDLFKKETIERMSEHYLNILRSIVEDERMDIKDIPLLTEKEKGIILREWNNTRSEYPSKKCVHQLFEDQVRRTPDSVAINFENQNLTYAELNAKANHLSRYLIKLGAKEGTIISICVHRNIELIIGLLAILKSGATYLPLDPIYPKARLSLILDDAKPILIVTESSMTGHLPETDARFILIDNKEDYSSESSDNLGLGNPDSHAYIRYTSGSTGKPKGVQINHQSVVNLICSISRLLKVTSQDVLLAVTTISFDISELEIYVPLFNGAKLVIASEETAINVELLKKKIDEAGVTIFQATPVTFRMLLLSGWKGKQDLKVICGGEAFPKKLAQDLLLSCGEVWNAYGPTETTIWSVIKKLDAEDCEADCYVPIGRPVDNTKLYVLDKKLMPVPIGIAGELYIGGDGVSTGYLNLEEMTNERFITDPFSNDTEARIYKTGDLVHYFPDGNLMYLNRVDLQVKIRGFRIELGEIESAISMYNGIKENAVVARADEQGEKALVAYCVIDKTAGLNETELRYFLKEKLPDYMIPSAIIIMDKLPLTANNKIDRKALPEPTNLISSYSKEYVAPKTETEKKLAAIWSSILKIEKIGVLDDFFEIGGHSLLATQLVTRIKNEFNVEIPFRNIFDHHTISGLLKYIDEQSATLQKKEKTPIPKQSSGRVEFPLSSSQKRLWFMDNYNPGMKAYNFSLDYKIDGDLDIKVLQRTLEYLINRHESFRTIFPVINEEPIQKVLASCPADLSIINLEDKPKKQIPSLIQHYSFENANHQFDLSNGPLFRFQILKTGTKESFLLINIHHIITDAVSFDIIIDEFKQVYEALKNSRSVNLPILPINYSDFSLFENQWLEGNECRNQLEFWKKELQGVPVVLQLPIDFPRPKKTTYNGTEFHFSLDAELKEKLAIIRKKTGAGMPLLSAFAILLHRYSLQDDFVLGFPVANRTHTELEFLTGIFVNVLPIRFTFPDEITISEVIENTKKKFLSAYENQEIPLDRLIEELKLKRSMNIDPLIQVLFNYLSGFSNEVQLDGAKMKLVNGERVAAQFDLILTINDNQQDIYCTFEYNTDLFRKGTIGRMSEHYLNILRAIVENETMDIKAIPLLTDQERDLILREWNNTQAEYPSKKCVHQLFEDQARKTPDSVAISFEDQSLTYTELNAKANQLARYLVKEGAGEGKIVAICVHRSIDLVIGLLAISKTGATYLPLDPIYPKARLSLILEDAKPVLLVSESEMSGNLPETKARIVQLNDKEKFSSESSENLGKGNSNDNAYILYTSGSTGKPKGVQIRQHSVVNLLLSMRKSLRVTARDILLAVTTISFDIAELEIFLPLISGAKLVIATEDEAMNVDLLKGKIEETGATIFQATPVTFRMLLLSGWDGKKDLKVMCGGEAFSKELAHGLLLRCEEVWNGYGPTEATIYSVIRKILGEDCEGEGYVPIGRPVDNTKLYVLNQKLMPVPVGVAGELFIGGAGVSMGYLNLNEMTNERFIPDPFSHDPDARIYKTGDLVHYFPDGTLMYLNRVDLQVKIRGYRIELGEIESAISKFTGIKENAVVVYTDEQSEKVLVAYCVIDNGTALNETELRQFLKEKLPDYMVPSAFVLMEKLPLTANNKVDRKALPEPTNLFSSVSKDYVEPTTDTEKKLAAIWSSILKIEKIGILDNFFEIGGHSMIAVTLIIKIEKDFGIRLPLATLFEHSNIQELSKVIEEGIAPDKWRSLVPLRPNGKKKPLFLIHGMGLNVLLYTTIINYLDPEQPVYGLQAKGLNGVEKPLETFEEIASYYISEIMTVDSEGPYQLAGFSMGGKIAYELARQLMEMGKRVSFVGILDTAVESSIRELPVFQKVKLKCKYMLSYILWNVAYLFKHSNESMFAAINRRFSGLWKKIRGSDYKVTKEDNVSRGGKNELPKYLRKVHHANLMASRRYAIKPYNGCIHLFKATHQTFYIPDPVYYDWDKYALGGVVIHEVPGEHSTIFAPPNDKYFSSILQKSLDESMIQS